MQAGEVSLLPKALPVDPNGQLPLQKPNRVGHTVFRRNTQAQMDVIRHRMSLYDLNPLLLTEVP